MKKYLFILLSVITLAGFTACSEDELAGSHQMTNDITIVSQNVCFEAAAAQGTIVYTAPGTCSVTSNADWCKVTSSGNTINVSVDENTQYEGRSAVVAITYGSETRKVNVTQNGIVINFKFGSQTVELPFGGGTFTVTGSATDVLEVTSDQDWAHATLVNDTTVSVTVDKNPTFNARTAKITIAAPAHENSAVVTVKQAERTLPSVEGTYALSFYTKYGDESTLTSVDVTITKGTEDNSYVMDLSGLSEGWKLPMTMDTENQMFIIKNCAYIGMYNYQGTDYYANMLVYYTNGTSLYYSYTQSSSYDIYLSYTIDDNTNKYSMSLYNSAAAINRTSLGMQVNLFKTDEPVKANRLGGLLTMVYPSLTSK